MTEKTTLNKPTDPACFLPHVTGCADNKPKLLDLYCCGGGASYGYELAGWDVVGVDIDPQPKYRGKFIQSDALEYLKAHYHEFDAVHASPPCQRYSKAAMQFRIAGKEYPDLIEPTRELLKMTGLPYIIENVPDAPLHNPILLCGAMFGIRTYRHRLFESNIELKQPEHPEHIAPNAKMGRKPMPNEFVQYMGHFSGVKIVQDFTGLHWLGQKELAQSIPPQYTEWVGRKIRRCFLPMDNLRHDGCVHRIRHDKRNHKK